MASYTIGEMARVAGVGVETIRFYQRKGLLPVPSLVGSRGRVYTDDDVGLVSFIRRAKDLGFTLREIGAMLALRSEARTTVCGALKTILDAKCESLDRSIKRLTHAKEQLLAIRATCTASTSDAVACPILQGLRPSDRPECAPDSCPWSDSAS